MIPKSKTLTTRLFLGAVLLLVSTVAPLQAQATGTTNVSVDFPPLVVLWYYDSVNVDISPADLAGVLISRASGDTAVNMGGLTRQPAFSPDLSITPSLDGDAANVGLTLRNSWAVLSVGSAGGGNTQVDVSFASSTLTGPGGNSIALSNLRARSANSGGAGTTIDFPATGLRLSNVEVGDLIMDLDLRDAAIEGAYSGGQVTITASNL